MTQTHAQRIAAAGIQLPPVPKPVASYIPAICWDGVVQTAGQIPVQNGPPIALGVVPDQIGVADAADCARLCALNAVAAAASAADGLDNLERPLKVTCFVAATPGFTDHAMIANGASALLAEVFGDAAPHARSAVGVASLPLGVPVEVEILFKLANADGSA